MKDLEQIRFPLIGGFIGLLLALFIITFGFFKTLLILLLVSLGVGAGYYYQQLALSKK